MVRVGFFRVLRVERIPLDFRESRPPPPAGSWDNAVRALAVLTRLVILSLECSDARLAFPRQPPKQHLVQAQEDATAPIGIFIVETSTQKTCTRISLRLQFEHFGLEANRAREQVLITLCLDQ